MTLPGFQHHNVKHYSEVFSHITAEGGIVGCVSYPICLTRGICFIQEHWLFTEHLSDLNSENEFISVGVSGMNSGILLCGLPYGDYGVLYLILM